MSIEQHSGWEIAIIGMSGRFPGASTVQQFWQNVKNGVESVTFFTPEELLASGVDPELLRNPSYVRARAVLDGSELFDAQFFEIPPREAELMDPQHRLWLECCWEALEQAGYAGDQARGRVGVYAGIGMNSYLLYNIATHPELIGISDDRQIAIGNDKDYISTRTSYKLNLSGPSVAVQSACSTSLAAVHMACQGLLSGECDMALAGGMSIRFPQKTGYLYRPGNIDSPDGHCRAFDADGQGIVRGSGGGVVVLKRLEDALADGDYICAVIKGSAMNNDGAIKAGYTAPSVEGQSRAIKAALLMAEVDADTVSYVEAHGTGTMLGDPIEIAALTKAFRSQTEKTGFCALGSVKTNIGHLDAGAGIAGLLKAVHALMHRQLPPSLNFTRPNPQIDFANSPFYVNTSLRDWEVESGPRRAGVSSFGIGGTNVHVILEEAPARPATQSPTHDWHLLLLSARTETALDRLTDDLVQYLQEQPEIPLADVAATLQIGRKAFHYRRMLVCSEREDALHALTERQPGRVRTATLRASKRSVAFLFPGQGAQYIHMGREFYAAEPVFRTHIDHCCELLKPLLGMDLREIIYPVPARVDQATAQLQQTNFTQVALFVVEYSLAQLWLAWGIRPQALLGHSLGEYVAATLAGVFTLEDALKIVVERGRLMQQLPPGGMLDVPLSEEALRPFLTGDLELAAINGPSRCVVAGPREALNHLNAELAALGIAARTVNTAYAFHSSMVEPIMERFTACMAAIKLAPPTIPFLSNVTGTWITPAQAMAPAYWTKHLRACVRFADGLRELAKEESLLALEVGPGQTLSSFARHALVADTNQAVFPSLQQSTSQRSELFTLFTALGQLWLSGVVPDWRAVHGEQKCHRFPLPTYPFERQRYWIEPARTSEIRREGSLEKKADIADWFYHPFWQPEGLPSLEVAPFVSSQETPWLVFLDEYNLGNQLVAGLRRVGQTVVTVMAGSDYARSAQHTYQIRPGEQNDYSQLLQELAAQDLFPEKVVYLWSFAPLVQEEWGEADLLPHVQERNFACLLFLARSLGGQVEARTVHIDVISNNMQVVDAEDQVDPVRAILLGPCAVIPYEYATIKCKSIDVPLYTAGSWWERELVELLLAELAQATTQTSVAYRGGQRLVQAFAPARFGAAPAIPSRLRERGVYIITGGLGAVGLQIAAYLARSVQAKLVLVGRTPLPERAEWDRLLAGDASRADPVHELQFIDLREEADRITLIGQRAVSKFDRKRLVPGPEIEGLSAELCARYAYAYLLAGGIDMRAGSVCTLEHLFASLHIQPRYRRLVLALLCMLNEDGIVRLQGDTLTVLKGRDAVEAPDRLHQDLVTRYPEFVPILDLLARCMSSYPDVLAGRKDGLQILFPDGSSALLEHISTIMAEHSSQGASILVVREVLNALVQQAGGRRLRVLEVGAGNGRLTRELLPLLKDDVLDYTFTDIGKAFVLKWQEEAQRVGISMQYGLLDIARDPQQQGYVRESFDIILALNVIHATPEIAASLRNLKSLLSPHGLLFSIETVKEQRWVDMIWGLTKEWWYFVDEDVRTCSPLLGTEAWVSLYRQVGFQTVLTYPGDEPSQRESDSRLFIAQRVGQSGAEPSSSPESSAAALTIQEKLRRIQFLETLGAEVLPLNADVSLLEQMQAVLAETRQRFGAIHGVIHAAVGEIGGMIQWKTPEVVAREFDAKLTGTLVLDSALRDETLDFLLLFSSLRSVIGSPGLVTYCAASAFLDRFAQMAALRRPYPVIAIDWDRWQSLGTAVSAETSSRERLTATMLEGMTAAQGLEAFGRILAWNRAARVMVSVRDMAAALEYSLSFNQASPRPKQSLLSLYPRPAISSEYVAPSTPTEQRVAAIWQEVLAISTIGIHDDFSELGGDSLLATQVVARLRKEFQVELPLQYLFEAPTIASLSAFIDGDGLADQADERAVIEQLLQEIEQSSSAEVADGVSVEANPGREDR